VQYPVKSPAHDRRVPCRPLRSACCGRGFASVDQRTEYPTRGVPAFVDASVISRHAACFGYFLLSIAGPGAANVHSLIWCGRPTFRAGSARIAGKVVVAMRTRPNRVFEKLRGHERIEPKQTDAKDEAHYRWSPEMCDQGRAHVLGRMSQCATADRPAEWRK